MFIKADYQDAEKPESWAWAPEGVSSRRWWGQLDAAHIYSTMVEFRNFTKSVPVECWAEVAAKVVKAAESLGVSEAAITAFKSLLNPIEVTDRYPTKVVGRGFKEVEVTPGWPRKVVMPEPAEDVARKLAALVDGKRMEVLIANPGLTPLETFQRATKQMSPDILTLYGLSTRKD